MHRNRINPRSVAVAPRAGRPTAVRARSGLTLAAATIVACAVFAATAAAFFSSGGTTQLSMKNVGENVATTKTTTGWSPLVAATRTVTVPNGAVVNARFTAQSLCTHNTGSIAGTCSVRITANGVPLKPNGGLFAFDSIGSAVGNQGGYESHAMERSDKLSAGTYTIQVALMVTAQTRFVVNYWHLAVEVSAP